MHHIGAVVLLKQAKKYQEMHLQVVWASLRLLTVLLLTAFALLAGRSGAIPGGLDTP